MKSIRISDQMYTAAEARAGLMNRSLAQQLEHWARLGQAVEAASSGTQVTQLLSWLGTNVQTDTDHAGARSPVHDIAVATPQTAALQLLRGALNENEAAVLCAKSVQSVRQTLTELLKTHCSQSMSYSDTLKLPHGSRQELADGIERGLASA